MVRSWGWFCGHEDLIFLPIQPILHLSCKFDNFWKKNCSKMFKHFWEKKLQVNRRQKASRGWEFFLGLVDCSQDRLVSTAYQKKPVFNVLHAIGMQHQNNFLFFKNGQIYMNDLESAELNGKSNFRFFRFLFFELWFFLVIFVLKMSIFDEFFTITRKIKMGKLFFHSFQHIAHLS